MTRTDSVYARWQALSRWPLGKALFSRLIGLAAPYTGSIGARVREMEPGRAVVAMNDRRRVRNHLRSVHAVALLNLSELASGLAVTASAPADSRWIITGLNIEYLKKARGLLVAEGRCQIPEDNSRREMEAQVTVRDGAGDEVARTTARVLVGPVAG